MKDPKLAELSGLYADKDRWYAVNDGGNKATVVVLKKDCTVERQIVGQTDPFDVEDLGRAPDGTFLLADGGDNNLERTTAALISLSPAGKSTLFRLTYPDGKHDAEALLVGANGAPYFITKEPGNAGVYSPIRQLKSPGPTPLKKVATIKLAADRHAGRPGAGQDRLADRHRRRREPGRQGRRGAHLHRRLPVRGAGQGRREGVEHQAGAGAAAERGAGRGHRVRGRRLAGGGVGEGRPADPARGQGDEPGRWRRRTPPAQQSASPKPPESQAPAPAGGLASNNVEKQGIPIVPAAAVGILLVMGVLASLRWRTSRSRRRFYRTGG